ncbi:hypothetical protein C8J57DRAFT_1258512 [Mycena rebaudengoi]|nr:hypothetical protein C8J57DRAFT_1258512 [Mycena rebaudengoi]
MSHLQQTSQELIAQLNLQKHPEGATMPRLIDKKALSPPLCRPNGFFHMNKSVTYHIHHQGRGAYTLITPGHEGSAARPREGRDAYAPGGYGCVEDVASLNADVATEDENAGCLITEVVVPGWVPREDHNFLTLEGVAVVMSKNGEVREFEKYVK